MIKKCLLLFFISLFVLVNSINAVENYALIIALSNYEKANTGFSNLHSKNDIPLLKKALISKGFKQDKIDILDDSRGTKKAIFEAFAQLISTVQYGDNVVVHISAHGQQIKDDDNDELDGYDEAFIPLDAKINRNCNGSNYNGENHIRDDKIKEFIDDIRYKIGPQGNVIFIGDFCHSGSSVRSSAPIRGTNKTFDGALCSFNKLDRYGIVSKVELSKMGSLIGFYASAPNESNQEIFTVNKQFVGAMSFAFSKAFTNAKPNATYRDLFLEIKRLIHSYNPNQTPQIDGDVDLEILGGKMRKKREIFNVIRIISSKELMVDIGSLNGVTKHSKLSFYSGEMHSNQKIAEGKIIDVDLLESTVQINQSLKINRNELLKSSVKVSDLNYGDLELLVAIDKDLFQHDKNNINKLKSNPFFKIVHDSIPADIYINKNALANGVLVKNNAGYNIYDGVLSTNQLTHKLVQYAKSKYLKSASLESEGLLPSLKLLKLENGTTNTLNNVNTNYSVGDTLRLQINNPTNNKIYVTVLDIQPDGKINCMVPEQLGLMPEESFLPASTTKEFPLNKNEGWIIQPPLGREVIKVILSIQPLYLCEVIDEPISHKRGKSTFETHKILQPLLSPTMLSRGENINNVAKSVIAIETVLFDIINQK